MTDSVGKLATIQVYSRPGCHLCEILVEALLPLIRGRLELEILDIDTCEKWRRRYGLRIPIVMFNGTEICQYTLDKDAIGRIVDAEKSVIRAS